MQKLIHWNPPKVSTCRIRGFAPLLLCDRDYILQEYGFNPLQDPTTNKPVFQSGSFGRFNITLQTLWNWHKADWNVFSIPTTSFNLCRFVSAKLRFFRHPNINYMVILQQDYCDNTRGWPYFHPAKIIFQKHHHLVLSKMQSGLKRNYVTVRIKPRPTDTNAWHLMAQMANHTQFTILVVAFDVDNPFQKPDTQTIEIRQTTVPWGSWANQGSIGEWRYHWIWDSGKQNAFIINDRTDDTPPRDKEYADGLYKETPYWLSLFGLTHSELQKTWIWIPDQSIFNIGTRKWGKLKPETYMAIIKSGPFFLKGLIKHFSLNMMYNVKFQFGGPDIDEGYDAGLDPKNVPPGCKPESNAYNFLSRVETSDIASRARALANAWEFRRGLLTKRAFERLTRPLSPAESPGRSGLDEIAHWPSEEDITSAEEEEEKDSLQEKKKKKRRKHRHSY